MRKWLYIPMIFFFFALLSTPVFAQADPASSPQTLDFGLKALALAIAAAGCGYGQSKVLTAACEGVSRNPGSADSIRFFFILGLAFIEFLALLTFLYVGFF